MKTIEIIRTAQPSEKILSLKNKMFEEKRFMSLEQAHIITESYKKNEALSTAKKRAHSLAAAMDFLHIAIDPEELIIGNRTAGVRAGVVFPESGISWIDKEIETLHCRPQDKFNVHPEDIKEFREFILPYWKGKSLEDTIRAEGAELIDCIAKVVKINQKDHAQGHICPDTEKWIRLGPAGICKEAETYLKEKDPAKIEFYECVIEVLNGARRFMRRYADLASEMQKTTVGKNKANLAEIERICRKLASDAPECGAETFREALQALWFLYVLLQMESNASSFSPGRADQYLYPYYRSDIDNGTLNDESALELIEALWLKFNQIVYLRNSHSAAFFAGFPIGFNIALGGIKEDGSDASNELSYLFLKAQEHLGLPQPNLSARLHEKTPEPLLNECAAVIGKGSGMPQVFNDESIVPALIAQGISEKDAKNYAIVGCVELTTHGNNLGWSDAAMFNLPKVLELALNDGVCLLTGQQLGPKTGTLEDFKTYEDVEKAFQTQIDYFFDKMISACEVVEKVHQRILPTAFLSSVINDCLEKGIDVTAGGAHYNLSGIQVIQPANIADSLAALKQLVYDEKKISKKELLQALRTNFKDAENLRAVLLNDAPKYGNDIGWVDNIANKWIVYFSDKFKGLKNYRGGRYHTGMYTVSAHVPMGANVGASPDGRLAGMPLADGGQSAVYGRDINGPTAVLKSVSRIDSSRGSNGTLLNMKFLPQFFKTQEGIRKFSAFLRGFVRLKINHAQFNVVRKEDLLAAQKNPEAYDVPYHPCCGLYRIFYRIGGRFAKRKLSRVQVMTIFDIQRFSLHDGPGIRTTVFLKGCPLRCLWCQNPEGLEFGIDNVQNSKNVKKYRCIAPEILAEEVQADSVFFEVSGGGVTFSGGEALAQIDDVCTAADILRTKKIHTAVETSLCVPRESIQKAVDSIDLILADIKIFDTEKHKAAIGADNELIRENFKYAAEKLRGTGRLIARTPLIPGYTANEKNITEIGAFIGSIDFSIQWELLNFNPLASAKYNELHNDGFKLFEGLKQFSDMQMNEFKKIAASCGVSVI